MALYHYPFFGTVIREFPFGFFFFVSPPQWEKVGDSCFPPSCPPSSLLAFSAPGIQSPPGFDGLQYTPGSRCFTSPTLSSLSFDSGYCNVRPLLDLSPLQQQANPFRPLCPSDPNLYQWFAFLRLGLFYAGFPDPPPALRLPVPHTWFLSVFHWGSACSDPASTSPEGFFSFFSYFFFMNGRTTLFPFFCPDSNPFTQTARGCTPPNAIERTHCVPPRRASL